MTDWHQCGPRRPTMVRSMGSLNVAALRSLVPRPLAGKVVLDAGCGSGAQCEWLLHEGAEVIGIDLSPAMVEEARRRCGREATIFVADLAEPLAIEPGTLDGITCSLALHYLRDWDVPLHSFRSALRLDWVGCALPRSPVRSSAAIAKGRRRPRETPHRRPTEFPRDGHLISPRTAIGIPHGRTRDVPIHHRSVPPWHRWSCKGTHRARKEHPMLSKEKQMDVLEAYDLTKSLRGAAQLTGVDHHTVARYVAARAAGRAIDEVPERPKSER